MRATRVSRREIESLGTVVFRKATLSTHPPTFPRHRSDRPHTLYGATNSLNQRLISNYQIGESVNLKQSKIIFLQQTRRRYQGLGSVDLPEGRCCSRYAPVSSGAIEDCDLNGVIRQPHFAYYEGNCAVPIICEYSCCDQTFPNFGRCANELGTCDQKGIPFCLQTACPSIGDLRIIGRFFARIIFDLANRAAGLFDVVPRANFSSGTGRNSSKFGGSGSGEYHLLAKDSDLAAIIGWRSIIEDRSAVSRYHEAVQKVFIGNDGTGTDLRNSDVRPAAANGDAQGTFRVLLLLHTGELKSKH